MIFLDNQKDHQNCRIQL